MPVAALVPGRADGLAKPLVVPESDVVVLHVNLVRYKTKHNWNTHRKLWNSKDQSPANCRRPLNRGAAAGPRTIMVITVVVVVRTPDDHVNLQSSSDVVSVYVVVRPLIAMSYSTLRPDRVR